MIRVMAGKAPLLLAMVLFAIGVSGLALSSAEHAHWGPFEPGSAPATQRVRVVDSGTPFAVPSLDELFTSRVETAVASEPAPEAPSAAAPAAPALPPLRVYGISSDDGGVSAAAAEKTTPPVTVVNVANDDDATNVETPTPPEVAHDPPVEEPEANPEDKIRVVPPKGLVGPANPQPAPVTAPAAVPNTD